VTLPETDLCLKTALEAAARATQIVKESAKGTLEISTKSSPRDLVTQIDLESEHAIRETIRRRHPDHSILGEEGGLTGSSPYRWIVDPIDGTSNFARGIPHFAVSIGIEYGGRGLLGVIANPTLGDTYQAVIGQGAFKNARRLFVSLCTDLSDAFMTMSFSADARVSDRAGVMWDALLTRCQTLRRMGSTALELALLAEGKTDAFVGFGQGAWDVAAGTVLVKEAGGEVGLLDSGATCIAAASGELLEQLEALL
jgi:myo-inositol-1(or 4)-monophosphatase